MLFDTHMHCEFSTDSSMKLVDAIKNAKLEDIGIIITEHWDNDYPTNPEAFLFDVDKYLQSFQPYRNKKVLLGIEVGMQKHTQVADEKMLAKHDFDYVLASIHCVGKKDLYEATTYHGKTKLQSVKELIETTIDNLNLYSNFDALAHIDYMCRYMPYDDKELRYQEMPELFDELFKTIIANEKVLEINTRRLDNKETIANLLELYKRYHELGGKYVTIGSDAHYAEHVGRRLKEGLMIAKEADLEPVYFENRKMKRMGV